MRNQNQSVMRTINELRPGKLQQETAKQNEQVVKTGPVAITSNLVE